jgi:8-oxo-dGTP pyrophosphatase MutT (NUDIX family)
VAPVTDLRHLLTTALRRPTGDSSDFDLNPAFPLPEGRVLRPAAVLVAIMDFGDEPRLLLTKRASHLKHHPGQIAFPGGKVDDTDADAEAAALREAREEVGLDPANVDILGHLPPHETVTGFRITPVLGWIRADFTPVPEPGEVEEVFAVPLRHILNPANFRVEQRIWHGQPRYYYTAPFGPYYIWGATARILRGLAERMSP